MHTPGWASGANTRVQQLLERVAQLRAFVERTIFWRVWERMLENEFLDRSVALAAKAFVSFFPALIVVASFMPTSVRTSILESITRRAGLSGGGLATVKGAFANSDDTKRATGVVGLIFTFFFISSFTTALGRVYVKAWRRPPTRRVSGYAIGASWLIGVIAYFSLIGGLRAIFGSGPKTAVFAVLVWLAGIGLWWVTPWLMLQRQVRPRVLLTTAILTGTAMVAYAASASVWMPRTVAENQRQFGFFGVALSLVTWLTGASVIIVVGACAGPVVAEDRGPLGRLARGGDDEPVLVAGAAPSLGAPMRAPTLTDALGIPRRVGDRSEDDDPDE